MGFNADFDGDQMAVHIPYLKNHRTDIDDIINMYYIQLMAGSSIPTQDMIMGL